ncbi:hypothetical protein Taro_020690 [Colocasia esculenta]|uniref:Uncharacterized protein n=1 Tax=Colocasia esculenta TaxID=4460 RepID=A0A843V339_COLES|nr:hypothetical protein [Colocasia esculenta]
MYKNIVNVTVELSSFGRPKKEKLEPHLRPLREATAPTQPSQPGSQPSQPTIHRRQRETSDIREHPEDIHRRQRGLGREAKRIVYTGEGLVTPTGPCTRGSPPLLPSARGSSSRELGVGRVAEVVVAPCCCQQ